MIQENNILCIYHGNCADGFGAAWSVWKRFPNAIFMLGYTENYRLIVLIKMCFLLIFFIQLRCFGANFKCCSVSNNFRPS